MYKKWSLFVLMLLILMPIVSADEFECYCQNGPNGEETIARLDATCKSRCGEFKGTGTCVGWSLINGDCLDNFTCATTWKLFCNDGISGGYWVEFSMCYECSYEDQNPPSDQTKP